MPKQIISPAQGLLILLDHYKKNQTQVTELKKLYLCGADTEVSREKILSLLKDPILSKYQVQFDMQTINEDPTRRYFETHLAYESLISGLDRVDMVDLEDNFEKLNTHFTEFTNFLRGPKKDKPLPARVNKVGSVLEGTFNSLDDKLFLEYSDYIAKIKKGTMFPQLSSENKNKMELLIKSVFLGIANASFTRLPLDIYMQGNYSTENKGKAEKEGQETTRNQNLGLMRGYMPVALDDIARSKEELSYLKSSDQSSFIEDAAWVKSNFDKLVHPFSNSISGTMLCQLRNQADLLQNAKGVFTDSAQRLEQYIQLFISAVLLHSGGHSLNEFIAPLTFPKVQKEFSSIPNFSEINLESMYLSHNTQAFDTALQDAIEYNKSILLRQELHLEFKTHVVFKSEKQMLSDLDQLSNKVTDLKDKYGDRVKNQWFSSLRSGLSKNQLIQVGLSEAIKKMKDGDLTGAQNDILRLKEAIISKFGKTNLWGTKSESFKLVESVEKELTSIKAKLQDMREELSKMRRDVQIPGVENLEENRPGSPKII